MKPRLRAVSVALAAAIALVPACKSSSSSSSSASPADPNTVSLEGLQFHPDHLTVKAGTTVTWRWDENVSHDVTDDAGHWASQVQSDGVYTHTFSTPGVTKYRCTIHPGMTATITVTP